MKRFLIPLAIFIVLAGFLAVGLRLDPREVPSPLVGKPAPAFKLATLDDSAQQLGPADLRGQVWLLNVWASWCGSCREEHDVLVELSRRNVVPIYGLDYKDTPRDARMVLAQMGNPYTKTVVDLDGRVGIDYGVYGVPETYVIDKNGVIQMKHTGPISFDVLEMKILPLVRELQK